MCDQARLLDEAFATVATRVWLLARVDSLMDGEISFLDEAFPTLAAHVGLLPCMRFLV